MKISRFLIILSMVVTCHIGMSAAGSANDGRLFPYPVAPDDIQRLDERCNYLVDHFWDRCVMKTAFSSRDKLNAAMGDWFSFMPYATADTVHMSVERLLKSLAKQPDNLLTVCRMAEGWLYSDTASVPSDELYLPFLKAVTSNKKISSANKARYAAQLKSLQNSIVGQPAADLQMTLADGSRSSLYAVKAPYTVVLFNDPDCSDCTMARVRLAADYNIGELIDAGEIAMVSIYPGEADDTWRASLSALPSNWVAGASPDADSQMDMRATPMIYLLDADHRVVTKGVPVDNVIAALNVMNMQRKRRAAAPAETAEPTR